MTVKKRNSNSLTLKKRNSNLSTTRERIQIQNYNSIQPYSRYYTNKQNKQQFFIDQVDINSMQTVKIINTATWQGDND